MTPAKFASYIERSIGRSLTGAEAMELQSARDRTVTGKRDAVKAMWEVSVRLGLKTRHN